MAEDQTTTDKSNEETVATVTEQEVLTESEMDLILAEEDPDFIKKLGEIKIDNASAELSLMDQVLDKNGQIVGFEKPFLKTLKAAIQFTENPKIVVPFWILNVLIFVALFFIVKNKSWNKPDSLFLTSYAEWGLEVNSYNPMTETEMFFDNGRLLKNIVVIKKMVANLKPSETSSKNPMLAFELNIEGMTSEVVVEIKDREAEFKDLILRTVEERNYDELNETIGKQNLAEQLLNVLNANLTRGQIRKVLYKSFILKN